MPRLGIDVINKVPVIYHFFWFNFFTVMDKVIYFSVFFDKHSESPLDSLARALNDKKIIK